MRLRYGSLSDSERATMAFGILTRLYQLRYFVRDYIVRKPYKVISYKGEFGSELKWAIPFAYWHWLNGTLLRTESYFGTKDLYFFSPNHTEVDRKREFFNSIELPNSEDHNFSYSFRKWTAVRYDQFKSQINLAFDKPLLIISNKFNTEFHRGPVNFISLPLLHSLFETLSTKFSVIYNRPNGKDITEDNSRVLHLGEETLLEEYKEKVFSLSYLYSTSGKSFQSFNHFQLAVYANCRHFISVQGGNSVLSSYFGGTNIVLLKAGAEMPFHEYEHFYPRLSGAKIITCASDTELLASVSRIF